MGEKEVETEERKGRGTEIETIGIGIIVEARRGIEEEIETEITIMTVIEIMGGTKRRTGIVIETDIVTEL